MNSFTAVSEVTPGGPRVVAPFGRADRDRAFRAAVRHSRHVRILRVVPRVAALAFSLSGVSFHFLMTRSRPPWARPAASAPLGFPATKTKRTPPRLAGITRDNRHYDMVAQAAAQDVTKPDMLELH